jgi:hypothetical protein
MNRTGTGKSKSKGKERAAPPPSDGEIIDINVSDASSEESKFIHPFSRGIFVYPISDLRATATQVSDVKLLTPFVPKTRTGTGTGRSNDTGYFYVQTEIEVNGKMVMRRVCKACL